MDVLVTCEYEEYPIKNEGAGELITSLLASLLAHLGQRLICELIVYICTCIRRPSVRRQYFRTISRLKQYA